jgi:DNA-binding IclR family transcriptional regulator
MGLSPYAQQILHWLANHGEPASFTFIAGGTALSREMVERKIEELLAAGVIVQRDLEYSLPPAIPGARAAVQRLRGSSQ